MRVLIISILTSSIILCSANGVSACACFTEKELSAAEARAALVKDVESAVAIFAGEVISRDEFSVKFKVEKVWKGEVVDEYAMSTGAVLEQSGQVRVSSCDYAFYVGKKYLVYAYQVEERVQARECTRTRLLQGAEKEMMELDQVKKSERRSRREQVHIMAGAKSNKMLKPTRLHVAFCYMRQSCHCRGESALA